MDEKPVFYDPRGRRGTFVTRAGAFVGTLVAVLTTLTLLAAVFAIPAMPGQAAAERPSALPGLHAAGLGPARVLSARYRNQLAQEIARHQHLRQVPIHFPKVVAGFYAPWEASGLASLRAHASSLTHLIPQWLHLSADGSTVNFEDFNPDTNPPTRDAIQIAHQNGLSILPILDNGVNGVFDRHRAALLLDSPEKQRVLSKAIVRWLLEEQFQGINLDFELLDARLGTKFVGFLKILRADFDKHQLRLTADVEADTALPLDQVADQCDWLVLMAYDQHDDTGKSGPIAALDWSADKLKDALDDVPNEKLVFGMGNYAYDWVEGKAGAENLTFQEALSTASGYRVEPPSKVIQLEENSLNNTFAYRDDSDRRHIVWMLDAVSAFNQWKQAREEGIRGAALWYLGAEDPDVWSFFDRRALGAPMDGSALATVRFPYEISFEGRGEILSVRRKPQEGSRKVELDDSGFITACSYTKYAFPYLIQKSGYIPKKLALTFDDGPDPEWTPKILEALKDLKVPATFFVIGNSCEQHPNIVSDEYADGEEVGSHSFLHPNMGAVSLLRDRLELNLTQLAIEAATGRSTILFRPPFNADSEPETAEQIKPIEVATEKGYVTVAENVDPTDWDLNAAKAGQAYVRKTGEWIADFVDHDLRRRQQDQDEGNVILLHDAGGDRAATVDALRLLVPRLRAEGYDFVPVSYLMGTNRDHVMPPIPAKDLMAYWLAKIVLGTTYAALWILSVAFTLAIGLGLLRIFLMTALALVAARRRKAPTTLNPESGTPVSVIIPAYREEPVIHRTVESVLASRYPLAEVIVVDDGSPDATADIVRSGFGGDDRVRLLTKENGGKASALNLGISQAIGEVLICIDADTQLDPDAIGRLVAHFESSEVGAVAGNVKVGNEVNVITYWQSLEYTTSQNLDRRAYAMLNAVTVVPGAIGAWRRAAVERVGGYLNDTLAEDMDLTWRLRRAGYRIENEPAAVAFTEAPETFRAFFRQRFRWAYGTLQCLYKHRRALGRYGWFGRLALPALWLFQVLFQALAPLVDLELLISVVVYAVALFNASNENGRQALGGETQTILQVGFLYALFFLVDLVSGAIAMRMDRGRYSLLWWLFIQRFAYRQIMYGVIYRSLVRAITGGRAGWGKIDRKGTVRVRTAT